MMKNTSARENWKRETEKDKDRYLVGLDREKNITLFNCERILDNK